MAQNPIGSVTDEERLVPLHTHEDGFHVDVSEPVRTADVPEEGSFAWRLREEDDVPRLALAPVDDPERAGALYTRELSTAEDALTLDVPEPLLVEGLNVEVEVYDGANPLLFKPDEIAEGVAVGMEPRGRARRAGGAGDRTRARPILRRDAVP